jgi:hypothetical protein
MPHPHYHPDAVTADKPSVLPYHPFRPSFNIYTEMIRAQVPA